MARAGWSTSNILRCSFAVVTAPPATLVCWAKTPNLGIGRRLISIGNSASSNSLNNLVLAVQAGNVVLAQSGDGSTATAVGTSTTITTNTWFHAAAVFGAVNDRRAFLNGGGKNTDTTSRTPTGINRTSIGAGDQTTISAPFDGDIAEAAVWNIALSDAEVLALSKGLSPLLMHPEALVAYWPLIGNNSPENNLRSNSATMSIVGSLSKSVHPPIFMPKRRKLIL